LLTSLYRVIHSGLPLAMAMAFPDLFPLPEIPGPLYLKFISIWGKKPWVSGAFGMHSSSTLIALSGLLPWLW